MVGIPTADEFMKNKQEFDAKIDSASNDDGDLNAGLLLVYFCLLSKLIYFFYLVGSKLWHYFMRQVHYSLFWLRSLWF